MDLIAYGLVAAALLCIAGACLMGLAWIGWRKAMDRLLGYRRDRTA